MSTREEPSPAPAASAVDRENPWPGLGSYDESMHGYFFGRDAEVEELQRLVRRDPVALFYGQSGLGKSSLLQAGLFPRLRAVDLMPVHIRLRFGADFPHPIAQILQEVAAAAHRAGGEAPAAPPGVSLFEYFYDETHEFWSARNRVLTPVIVFDQFEEIFTLGARDAAAAAHRDELLAQLADLAARRAPDALVARFEHDPSLAARYSVDHTRCRLLFSLREDFLPELDGLRDHLPTLASGGLRLQRLRGHQAREVLEKPGAHLLEPDTTERIIRFVAAERASAASHELAELEVEPALLNVVARELNNRRRARGLDRISADLVRGARDEILVDFYERAFAGLEPHVREFVEDQLLTTTGFRDSVAVEDAEASYRVSRDTLAVLVDRRLLRIDERFQMQRVELTHDLLAGVVKASRDSRREREAVAAERRRAEEAKRVAEQAAADAQARLHGTRMRALIGTVMVVLTVGVGGLVYLNHRKAEEARALAREKQAADAAREDARTHLQRANEAMAGSLLVQADAELATGGFDAAQLLLRIGAGRDIFPSESLAWFSAAANQPRILALEATVRIAEPIAHADFAPSGRLIAATSAGAVRFVPLAAPPAAGSIALQAPAGTLGEVSDATCVELLWDEAAVVAVGRRNRTVGLFDLASGRLLRELPAAAAAAASAGAGGPDTGATKSDAAKEVVTQAPITDVVECTRFSPDGRSLAAVTSDGIVTVWQLAAGAQWEPPPEPRTAKDMLIVSHGDTRLRSAPPEPALSAIAWAFDGSVFVTTARATAWFPPPTEKWETKAVRRFYDLEEMRGAMRPSTDGRGFDWIVAGGSEQRLHWTRSDSEAAAAEGSLDFRTSEATPDGVHALAAIPGADVVFAALRNGEIAVWRTDDTASESKLRVLSTVATGHGRLVHLRTRPDGRYLAAITEEGAVCLYRVSLPAALLENEPQSGEILRVGGEWLQLHLDRTLTRADGSKAGSAPEHAASPNPIRASEFLPDPADPERCLVFGLRYGDTGGHFGVTRLTTGELLWERSTDNVFSWLAVFSPDGSALAVVSPLSTSEIMRLDARTGEPLGAPLRLAGDVSRITWSGDGRRLAASNDLQEIVVFEPAVSDQPVVILHARHSYLNSLALDRTGHTLVYATGDARLVLERFAPGERRAALSLPLPAGASRVAIDAAPGAHASIAALIQGVLHVFTGTLPSEPDLEWSNLATIDGYDTTPVVAAAADTTRLTAAWTSDAVNIEGARLLRDSYAWIGAAGAQFAAGTIDRSPDELEKLRAEGDRLRERFGALAPEQPAFGAFRDELATATANLVTFSKKLAPDLTALQRWPIVLYQHSLEPGSDVASVFAVEEGLPAVVAEVKARAGATEELTASERAQYQQIVRLAAMRIEAEETVWEARATLQPALFTADEWIRLMIATPSAYLIDREANMQASEGEMENSNRLYQVLEEREPDALTYPMRRGNNLRKMGRREEALALFERAAEVAARAGNGEVEAEARVYRAWTFQEMDGRLPDARADMIAAARLAPRDAWTLRNAIDFLISSSSAADAVEPAAHLVAVQDNAANRQLQARVHLAIGDGAAARAAVEPLANSSDISTRLDIVELFGADPAYRNRVFAAEWAYTAYQATSDTKLEDRALRQLGPLWLDVDDLVRSRNALEELLKYKLKVEEQALVRAFQGRIDMRRRDLISGRESYQFSLRLNPEPWARVRSDHAHLLEWSGETAAALAEFAAASAAGEASEALTHVLAMRRLAPAEADRTLQEALARFPDDRALRLAHARGLLADDPATAQHELQSLDDGSLDAVSLTAAALLGRAAEAAQRNLPRLADTYGSDHADQAVLHALAFAQTREPAQRLAALREISTAIERGYRGDARLGTMPGLESLATDPLFLLADTALATEADTREGLFALARFNQRLAALITQQETKSTLLGRAGAAISRGVEVGVFTPADVLADPELAPFAGQF